MKNSKSFTQALDGLDAGQPELSGLRETLRRHASIQERGDQHQIWAWTRLREELRQPAAEAAFAWKRLFLPAAATSLVLAGLALYAGSRSDLLIDSIGSDLYAQTFKSGDAEVVWVTGYSYIPSSYPLK